MSDFIQLHFLTAYPPANLNRDDLGRPKTAVMGGHQRLRISSQCLKRTWRTSDVFSQAIGDNMGTRTRDIGNYAYGKLVQEGIDPERAHQYGFRVAQAFDESLKKEKKKKSDKKDSAEDAAKNARVSRQTGQLVHVSALERKKVDAMVAAIVAGDEPSDEMFSQLLGNGRGSVDIAMFGRMLASTPKSNIDAAIQVGHAISVHTASVEDDYFSAVDDLNNKQEHAGSAHIGVGEFGAGLFYHYVCINKTQLTESLDGNNALVSAAIRALVESCATTSPSGKQNSFASRSYASFMLVEKGSQQPRNLSVAFYEPVRGSNPIGEAIEVLKKTRERMEVGYGACSDAQLSFDTHRGEGSLKNVLEFVCA